MTTRRDNVDIKVTAIDRATSVMKKIRGEILKTAAGYLGFRAGLEVIQETIGRSQELNAKMASLRSVVQATGRDYNQVIEGMNKRSGQLLDELSLVDGALKGLSTKLTTEQMFNLIDAVTEASIAMGEIPSVQIPLIIRGFKQLNPNLLDNIGVTVRLDEVNRRIRDGYYGANTALTEYTQQQALYQEIISQTSIYTGQQATVLEEARGKAQRFSVEIKNLAADFGSLITETDAYKGTLDLATDAVVGLRGLFQAMRGDDVPTVQELGEEFDTAAEKLERLNKAFEQGKIKLADYRDAVQNVAKGLEDGVGQAADHIVEDILKITHNQAEANKLLFATFAERDIPLQRFAEAQQKLDEIFRLMANKADVTETYIITDWRKFWESLVVRDTSVFDSVAHVWETLGDLVQQGFKIPTDYRGLEDLLKSFGFTEDVIAKALEDRVTGGLEKARTKIAQQKTLLASALGIDEVPDELRADLEEINRLIQDSTIKDLNDLTDYYQARTRQDDVYFQAALVGKEEHTRRTLEIDRKYSQQLEEFRQSGFFSEAELRQLSIDLDNLAAEERAKVWNDYQREIDDEQRRELEKQTAYIRQFNSRVAGLMGNYVSSWVDALVEQRKTGQEFWDAMAKDFMKFFIKQAIARILDTFVPGLGQALQLFATPKYDGMARKEGSDFVEQFWNGASRRLDQTQPALGDNLAGAMIPRINEQTGAPSGGTTTVVNNYYQGVVTEDFLRADVLPTVELASKRKEVSLRSVTDDRFGGSYVFNS